MARIFGFDPVVKAAKEVFHCPKCGTPQYDVDDKTGLNVICTCGARLWMHDKSGAFDEHHERKHSCFGTVYVSSCMNVDFDTFRKH